MRAWKAQLLEAQDYRCFYCENPLGLDMVTYDHVVPTSKGGINRLTNKVAACSTCNGNKGDSLPSPENVAKAKATYAKACLIRDKELTEIKAEKAARKLPPQRFSTAEIIRAIRQANQR